MRAANVLNYDPRLALRQEKDAYWLSLSSLERIKKTVEEQNAIARSKIFAAASVNLQDENQR
jgi:hypothetical protein